MCPYLYLYRRNPLHRHLDRWLYSLKSTPIFLHTQSGLHPLHFLLYLHFECRMLLDGPFARPFLPYFLRYLYPLGLFFFSFVLSRALFVRLWDLRNVVRFL